MFRFRCGKYRDWMTDYCLKDRDSLDNIKREELERHIQSCPSCAKEVEFTQKIADATAPNREMKIEITDEMLLQLETKLFARIKAGDHNRLEPLETESEKEIVIEIPRWALGWGVAIAALVLIFIGHGVFKPKPAVVKAPDRAQKLAQREIN